jgi:hypothetical protein
MNIILLRALLVFVPAFLLFCRSIRLLFREKVATSFLQLFGAGCLVVVVLTHVCEALHLFPGMHWGLEHSVGHYLDFWSAVLGFRQDICFMRLQRDGPNHNRRGPARSTESVYQRHMAVS